MRNATAIEIKAINELAAKVLDYEFEPQRIGIIEKYQSDGPGYAGKLAVCLGGEPCFVNVVEYHMHAMGPMYAPVPVRIGSAEFGPKDYRPEDV
jgi:hypothetical protein